MATNMGYGPKFGRNGRGFWLPRVIVVGPGTNAVSPAF
jgi:hypothetical protein